MIPYLSRMEGEIAELSCKVYSHGLGEVFIAFLDQHQRTRSLNASLDLSDLETSCTSGSNPAQNSQQAAIVDHASGNVDYTEKKVVTTKGALPMDAFAAPPTEAIDAYEC